MSRRKSLPAPTDAQRLTVKYIRAAIDNQADDIRKRYPDATPTQWVAVATLEAEHDITRAQVAALVKLGLLEMRGTDGSGPEVKIA